jgi:MFS family permease
MRFKFKQGPWADILGGLALVAALPLAMTLSYLTPSLLAARLLCFAGCLLGGFGLGRKTVQVGVLLQTLPPAHMLGRASGLFQSVVMAGQLIGALATPVVVPLLLSSFTYVSLVTAVILAVVVFGTALRQAAVAEPVEAQGAALRQTAVAELVEAQGAAEK